MKEKFICLLFCAVLLLMQAKLAAAKRKSGSASGGSKGKAAGAKSIKPKEGECDCALCCFEGFEECANQIEECNFEEEDEATNESLDSHVQRNTIIIVTVSVIGFVVLFILISSRFRVVQDLYKKIRDNCCTRIEVTDSMLTETDLAEEEENKQSRFQRYSLIGTSRVLLTPFCS